MHILLANVINYTNVKRRFEKFFSKNKRFIFPSLFILLYVLFYFLIDSSSQSLIAHDEGLYARRASLLGSSDNWFSSPFLTPHHKTLGSYWLIALSIRIFGNSELALRLPSILASFLCLYSLYFIELKIVNKNAALISLFSLSSMPLWIQYSRYASPDLPFVLCILLVILFFLEFLESNDYLRQFFYIFLSGLFISTSFFIRSYMVFVPLIGLSPFLLYNLYRKKNIFRILFFSGILIGSIPTFLNFYFVFKKFGYIGIESLFNFAKTQAIGEFGFNNFILLPFNFIYLTFPVGLLFLILFVFTRVDSTVKYPLLIFCYPSVSLLILLCMSTSYPHYYLFLLPSLSILLSLSFTSNSLRFSFSKICIKSLLLITIVFTTIILLVLMINFKEFIIDYSYQNTVKAYIIILFLLLSYIISVRFLLDRGKYNFNLINFFYSLVIPQYFFISLLYNLGVVGSPNLNTKLFLRDDKVATIINSNTIYLFKVDSKIQTLLSYYLPYSKVVNKLNDITDSKYLITSDINVLDTLEIKSMFRSIKKFDNQFLLMNINK